MFICQDLQSCDDVRVGVRVRVRTCNRVMRLWSSCLSWVVEMVRVMNGPGSTTLTTRDTDLPQSYFREDWLFIRGLLVIHQGERSALAWYHSLKHFLCVDLALARGLSPEPITIIHIHFRLVAQIRRLHINPYKSGFYCLFLRGPRRLYCESRKRPWAIRRANC